MRTGAMCYMCYMVRATSTSSRVGVRELRQNLSIYLDRVKKGEALTVTERGAPVAILRPLAASATVLERLVAEGRATRPLRPLDRRPRPSAARLDRSLGDMLEELRAERS